MDRGDQRETAEEMGDFEPLLRAWRAGSADARDALFEKVQAELRAIAGRLMRGQAKGHTLAPTALVNEAVLKLCGAAGTAEDRRQFLRLAGGAMRQVLVDHARRKSSLKRGGGEERVPLDAVVERLEARSAELPELDAALERLRARDARLVEVVELRFLCGLSNDEVAATLGLSPRSVRRLWLLARTLLYEELR